MFVRIGDFCVRAWFGVVDNLAIDVLLGKSFNVRCIRGIFPSEGKVVTWNSRSISILSSLLSVISLFSDTSVLNVKSAHTTKSNHVYHDKEEEKFHLRRVSLQMKLHPFIQAEVSLRWQGESQLLVETVETHPNIIERRSSITAMGIMDKLPGVPFYILIANMSAKAASQPKYMIVASGTNAPTCHVHAPSDEHDTRGEAWLDNQAIADKRRVDTNIMTPPIEMGSFSPF